MNRKATRYGGRHVAMVNLDACVFRHPAYVEAHAHLDHGACSHTHAAWGDPCYGCSAPFKSRHKKENSHD